MNKLSQNIIKILLIIVISVVQITRMPYFNILGFWPNLVLLLVLLLAVTENEKDAYLVASLGGLILDLASPLFFGFYTLFFLILVLFTKILVDKFLSEITFFILIIFIIITTLFFDLLLSLIAHQFLVSGLVVNVFYSLIIGLILFRILNFYFQKR